VEVAVGIVEQTLILIKSQNRFFLEEKAYFDPACCANVESSIRNPPAMKQVLDKRIPRRFPK
jgi:hypothetical protein